MKLYSGWNQVNSYIFRASRTRRPCPILGSFDNLISFLEPVCFFFEMGVRGKMVTCGNKFLLTISNKKEIVYELEFTTIIDDGPRQGSMDLPSVPVLAGP